jgi:hypothetical protein
MSGAVQAVLVRMRPQDVCSQCVQVCSGDKGGTESHRLAAARAAGVKRPVRENAGRPPLSGNNVGGNPARICHPSPDKHRGRLKTGGGESNNPEERKKKNRKERGGGKQGTSSGVQSCTGVRCVLASRGGRLDSFIATTLRPTVRTLRHARHGPATCPTARRKRQGEGRRHHVCGWHRRHTRTESAKLQHQRRKCPPKKKKKRRKDPFSLSKEVGQTRTTRGTSRSPVSLHFCADHSTHPEVRVVWLVGIGKALVDVICGLHQPGGVIHPEREEGWQESRSGKRGEKEWQRCLT